MSQTKVIRHKNKSTFFCFNQFCGVCDVKELQGSPIFGVSPRLRYSGVPCISSITDMAVVHESCMTIELKMTFRDPFKNWMFFINDKIRHALYITGNSRHGSWTFQNATSPTRIHGAPTHRLPSYDIYRYWN